MLPCRFAAPLSVALLAYSVGITIYAATRKPAAQPRRAAAAGGAGGMPAGLISVDTDSMGSMMDSMDASDSEAGTMPRCKVCFGLGSVSTRAGTLIPCPCCLGKGH